MKTILIVFSSALALSVIAPAFADEDTMSKHEAVTTMRLVHHHASAQRMRAQQAEARAYAPATEGVDFSIGSQR